jgi:hypothetical protein
MNKYIQLPNGAEVISIDYSSGTVLAQNIGAVQPYVTWKFYHGDLSTTSYGHYFSDLEPAKIDFVERINN